MPTPSQRVTRGPVASRRGLGAVAAGAAVLVGLSGCGPASQNVPSSPPSITAHDSAWVDSAIALVGTQSGHDPVVRVDLDPMGASITTRKPDQRAQRQWRVDLAANSPVPGASMSPSATATPSASTGSASGLPTPSGRPSSARPSSTPVFPTPSGAPATPDTHVDVDNTLGNMGLGAFGDTQVLPMWNLLSKAGCTTNGWSISATAGWSGQVIVKGICKGNALTMMNGQTLPRFRGQFDNQLNEQIDAFAGVLPDQVARITITRTGQKACPTTMVADYSVSLAGPLHLRTSMTCDTITTTMLTNGWLPPDRVQVSAIKAKPIDLVVASMRAHRTPIASNVLVVAWSQLYGQAVVAPAASKNGRPAYDLNGKLLG